MQQLQPSPSKDEVNHDSINTLARWRILCMKSARTMRCKIYMMERTTILSQMKTDKLKVINDNVSDLFNSCKCGSQFHKLLSNVTTTTLRTRSTQKKAKNHHRGAQNTNILKDSLQQHKHTNNLNPNMSTMQQHCEVDVIFIK